MELLKDLLVPSNACLSVIALGALAAAFPGTRRHARWVVVAALLVLLALSSGWTATALLSPLERAYPPRLRDTQAAGAIVVLGAYGLPDTNAPLSSWPNDAGLFRVVEAVHLRERCPGCRTFISGSMQTADAMAKVIVSLGVPSSEVEIDGQAENTLASARNLADRLRGVPFFLVTSAGHMPRAVLAFRAQRLEPLPAPTDYRVPREIASANPWPTPKGLEHSDLAVHEYLGILWYRMQGM